MATHNGPIAEILGKQFSQPETQQAVKGIINSRIHDFLQNRLKTALPGLAPFIDQLLIDEFKEAMDTEIEAQLPGMLDEMAVKASDGLDSKKIAEAVKNSPEGKRLIASAKQEVIWWALIGVLVGVGLGFVIASFLLEGRLMM